MHKGTLLFSLFTIFYMASAWADQASCNADAKDSLNSCLQSTNDSNAKKNCLSAYYVEVAKCAYLQKEDNK
jgi:hypothetical protein